MENNSGNGVAWTALVVAILALILAWSAYNRAGADLEDQAVDVADEAAEQVDQIEDELDEELVDENEVGDEVETDASLDVTTN